MDVNKKLAIFFVRLTLLLCAFATANEHNGTKSAEYEVLNIGGLFAIHGQGENWTSPCGPFSPGGFEELTAMLFAVSKINENRSLLPGIRLRVENEDTCSSMELATKKSLNYTIINYQHAYDCVRNQSTPGNPILAIVGEQNSDISRAVTNLVGLFHIPVISYAATSSSLSGVKYFARTIPPDTFVTQALIDVLQKFQWNYIILLYSDSEYGRFAAESFRERIRREKMSICTVVDKPIDGDDTNEDKNTWKQIEQEKEKTKVVVVFATYEDFSGFLQTGKEGNYDLEQYIWLSDDMWSGRQTAKLANLTCMLKHAISVIPSQIYIREFATFFHNASYNLHYLKEHSSFSDNWFNEYHSFASAQNLHNSSRNKSSCVKWSSSEVSYVMDAAFTIAWALHDILKCNSTTKSCDKSEARHVFKRKLLEAIKRVNFRNDFTNNTVSFTRNGDPRNVKYSIVSLQHEDECFVIVGQWDCLVDVNETCKGNLNLKDAFTSGIKGNFLGVCGTECPAGQYKILDKRFAKCCWQCKNCSKNKYSTKSGSSTCKACNYDEWPNNSRTACVKVKPQLIYFTDSPVGIVLLCVNILSVKILIAFVIIIIKNSRSRMKIFSNRILCYILLFGILMCNVTSILILTDTHKDYCLLVVVLSKLGSTCTLATIFIKTNDVYRTYKKKILKDDPRFLSQGLKVMVVICLVVIDVALMCFSINFEGKDRKTSKTVYFQTEDDNTAYVHCGFIVDFVRGEIFNVLEIIFFLGLLLICTHQSYLTRKVTDNAHGLRYVFFGSLALSVNSMTMLLAQSFTDDKENTKELTYAFYHSFFATVALACIFIPKMEILVFHPEKDVLYDALRAATIVNADSMISMCKRDQPSPQIPDTSNNLDTIVKAHGSPSVQLSQGL